MNLDTLQDARNQYYQRKFKSCFYDSSKKRARTNIPVSELMKKMLYQLQPQKEIEEPCVVAVLIALAQEQYWAQKRLSGSRTLNVPGCTVLNAASKSMGTGSASEQMQSLSTSFKVCSIQ
jgi:hypothetical protein